MTASAFDQALFREQTPCLAVAFDEAIDGLFTSNKSGKARLEVYTADCIRNLETQRKQNIKDSAEGKQGVPDELGHLTPAPIETEFIDNAAHLREYVHSVEGFQAFFLGQRNSYSPLSTSLELFDTLARERDVSAQFRQYILYFGDRESEVEIAPPAARIRQLTWGKAEKESSLECLYGLRYVEPNSRPDVADRTDRWSLRQCAIYYQSSALPKGQTWVFATLSRTCRRRLDQFITAAGSFHQLDFFEVMILIIDTVIGNWRPYLIDLSVETDQHANQLLGASPDNRGPIGMADSGQRQILMVLDDKMGNSILAMRATKDDLERLFNARTRTTLIPTTTSSIASATQEIFDELDRLIIKVEALRSRLAGIASLVANFLDLSNGFALQQLGKESRRENEQMIMLSERMHELTEKTVQDAAAVKVLTILTLVYLPLTVVTNFFSTSFIGVSTTANRIFVTDDWWILIAAAVPLTIVTLYIWWVWSRIKAYQRYPLWWRLVKRRPTGIQQHAVTEKKGVYESQSTVLGRSGTDWEAAREGLVDMPRG